MKFVVLLRICKFPENQRRREVISFAGVSSIICASKRHHCKPVRYVTPYTIGNLVHLFPAKKNA